MNHVIHGASHACWVVGKFLLADITILLFCAAMITLAYLTEDQDEDWVIAFFMIGAIAFLLLPLLTLLFIMVF